MEYHDSLPALAALPRTAASLVAQFLLPCPPFPGRTGNVSTGITLDQRSLRRRGCRSRILLQWPHSQLPDVPEQYRRIGIEAIEAECGSGNRGGEVIFGAAFCFNGLTLNCLMYPNNIAALGLMPWLIWQAILFGYIRQLRVR